MLEFIVLTVVFLSTLTFVTTLACITGVLYGKFYWDGSEYTGSRCCWSARHWRFWRFLHAYFDFKTVIEHDTKTMLADPNRESRCLFVMWPHGVAPLAIGAALMHGDDPTLRQLGGRARVGSATSVLSIPGLRDLLLFCGSIDASRDNLLAFCRNNPKTDLFLTPGGMREMVRSQFGKDDLYLPHTGYISFAKEAGFRWIIPIFAERQTDIFLCTSWLYQLRDYLLSHFAATLAMPMIPVPLPIQQTMHVGRAVAVRGDENDDDEGALAVCGDDMLQAIVELIQGAKDPGRIRVWTKRENYITVQQIESHQEDLEALFVPRRHHKAE